MEGLRQHVVMIFEIRSNVFQCSGERERVGGFRCAAAFGVRLSVVSVDTVVKCDAGNYSVVVQHRSAKVPCKTTMPRSCRVRWETMAFSVKYSWPPPGDGGFCAKMAAMMGLEIYMPTVLRVWVGTRRH